MATTPAAAPAKKAKSTTESTKEKSPSTKSRKTTAQKALSFPYAVIKAGARQFCVSEGDMILVEKLEAEAGTTWTAEEVLLVASAPGTIKVGQPTVAGATVTFEVLQQTLDKKILIRHHRRRQSSQKTLGHRQPQTRILVKAIKG
jgi:large subunit ribosomal protein L21